MTLYLDTSALLRLILREPGALTGLDAYEGLVASELIVVESHRTLDRLRLAGALSADEAAARGLAITEWLEAIDLVLLRPLVLRRAAEPLPMPLGTLDAIHVATALVWRERTGQPLAVATHDVALATAARAYQFQILGV